MQFSSEPSTFQVITVGRNGQVIECGELQLVAGPGGTGVTPVGVRDLTNRPGTTQPGQVMIKFKPIKKYFQGGPRRPLSHQDRSISANTGPAIGASQTVEIVQFGQRGNRVAAIRGRAASSSKTGDQLQLGLVAIQSAR